MFPATVTALSTLNAAGTVTAAATFNAPAGDGFDFIELGYADASISGGVLFGSTINNLRSVLGVMQSASSADLADTASGINTMKKFKGKPVVNSDSGAVVTASGPLPADAWVAN